MADDGCVCVSERLEGDEGRLGKDGVRSRELSCVLD
jgi:hypothetical protein